NVRLSLVVYGPPLAQANKDGVAMKSINRQTINYLCLLLVIPAFAFGQASPSDTHNEWRSYGNDPGGMRYSALSQLKRSNVAQLQRAWTYYTGEVDLGLGKSGAR